MTALALLAYIAVAWLTILTLWVVLKARQPKLTYPKPPRQRDGRERSAA